MSTRIGPVRSVSGFKQALSFASPHNKAALVDVGADWCEFCHVLDNKIFVDPQVSSLLARLALIRVDVTSMAPENIELLNYLNAAGPPTLFVIDTSSGNELPDTRSVGPFEADDLADRLRPYAT
jgi:thiol:disulfide interchange protein